jgi:hypothetical protein
MEVPQYVAIISLVIIGVSSQSTTSIGSYPMAELSGICLRKLNFMSLHISSRLYLLHVRAQQYQYGRHATFLQWKQNGGHRM